MHTLASIHVSDIIVEYDNQILMLQRKKDKAIYPNMWATIGGHASPSEMHDPWETALRELEEETGLTRLDIKEHKLCYVNTEQWDTCIVHHYIYAALATTNLVDTTKSEEGNILWIDKENIESLIMTPYFTSLMAHFLATPVDYTDTTVILGVVDADKNLHLL